MWWNYRVLKEEIDDEGKKLEQFRVIEVYYDDEGIIEGWADCTESILSVSGEVDGDAYEVLKESAESVLDAFKLPMVIKGGNDKLFELGDKDDND